MTTTEAPTTWLVSCPSDPHEVEPASIVAATAEEAAQAYLEEYHPAGRATADDLLIEPTV
jgi:hypothetical protein